MKRVKNSRIELWAHIVSEHAAVVALDATRSELEELHHHEHNGPGGIRNHPESSRTFKFTKLGTVLAEADE